MKIALATPEVATTLEDGLEKVKLSLADAAARGAEIICFPEAYIPGLRGLDFAVVPFNLEQQQRVLEEVGALAKTYSIATIMGLERYVEAGRQIVAYVFNKDGEMLGFQTKNQLDPSEDPNYVPGKYRQLFTVNGLKFGVSICHEGWRYPETVRWAATRGAQVVFHPHHTGSDQNGLLLKEWGSTEAPYYERAMMCRSIENTIYFASVNYAMRFQESATCVIDPQGRLHAQLPYGEAGVLVAELDLEQATGLIANRYAPDRYGEEAVAG